MVGDMALCPAELSEGNDVAFLSQFLEMVLHTPLRAPDPFGESLRRHMNEPGDAPRVRIPVGMAPQRNESELGARVEWSESNTKNWRSLSVRAHYSILSHSASDSRVKMNLRPARRQGISPSRAWS